ncbi:hypothetical protein DNHGIG_40750 [Collibacillus ludicampi]|uniref:Uncharacterized protein n=1 Tax=Collibacillus ludicampi TaxID=2771369 RepID=A0AAV4LLF4_9BACL|nr:hypothetical protein [Collibacillus ludicampi]GIM48526.1 hypothetical protein DNHGIG_40750 [Collibacillus ludicampi]
MLWVKIFLWLLLTSVSTGIVATWLDKKFPVTESPNGGVPIGTLPAVFFMILYGYFFRDSIQTVMYMFLDFLFWLQK